MRKPLGGLIATAAILFAACSGTATAVPATPPAASTAPATTAPSTAPASTAPSASAQSDLDKALFNSTFKPHDRREDRRHARHGRVAAA